MYTPEEIQEIFDRYNTAVRAGIPVSEALAREMGDAVKGVKNYTATLNNSLKQLGQASQQAAVDIANGAKGTSVFNNSIESAGGAVATVASQFGVLGKGIGLVINALTGLFTAVNKQSDALYGSFQQLSRTGAVGAEGMNDVFQNMKRFGYTINELDRMGSALAENSKDFATFAGTAATGTKNVANMVLGLEDVRAKLFNLGLSVDDIVRGAAGYYRQMARTGRVSEATSAGALAYIKELETLTRLTGLQRKELEDQREAAEDIDQFYAALLEMDPSAAKNAYAVFNQLMAIDPSGKKARAFAVSMDGIIGSSEDQMQAIMSTNGEFIDLAMGVKQGRLSMDQFMQGYSDATRTNIDLQRELAKIGVTDFMGGLKSNVILANKGLNPFAKQLGMTEKEVADLQAGVNAATDAQSRARNAQINASNNMQSFINLGIAPATQALSYLTQVVENLTSILPGSKSKGYGQQGTGTKGGSLAATAGGAAAGATALSFLGPLGIAAGGIGGGLLGYAGYQMHGGAAVDPMGLANLRELIASGESGGNYNVMVGGGTEDLTNMTLAQVMQLQKQRVASGQGSAAGKYQIINKTLEGLIKEGGINTSQKFDQNMQDRLADMLIKRRGLADYQTGKISKEQFAQNLSKEWAALPGSATGKSYYEGVGNNRASMSWDQLMRGVEQTKTGPSGAFGFQGTISGPMSGYRPNILMHGNEDISIRPANANTIGDFGPNSTELFGKMVEKLDEMIYLSRNQLGVNEKMLKYQQ